MQSPLKKIIFIADTVTLCHQQSMVFVSETQKPCALLYGDQTEAARRMHKRSKVWFATPQIVVNMLRSGDVSLDGVSLIVFDEAHHCTKNSPYNIIMRDFYFRLSPQHRPRVFGMTASPGARKGFVDTLKTIGQLCLNIESKIVMPKEVWSAFRIPRLGYPLTLFSRTMTSYRVLSISQMSTCILAPSQKPSLLCAGPWSRVPLSHHLL